MVVEYLIWYATLPAAYHLYASSSRLDDVLRAEGTCDDSHRSGITDLNAFIMQDYLGAGFFHLILWLVIAVIFATIAAACTRLIRRRTVPSGFG